MRPLDVVSDRFEIERLAGVGGMGEVYRARDRLTGSPVALKVLRVQITGSESAADDMARFLREPRILAEIRHPAIVRYVAHGETGTGEPYLAMEWLEGESLSTRLARSRLGIAESVELVRRVAEALAFAHARGVVHRDLKPGNLWLEGGRIEGVKVLDFGLARLEGATHTVTQIGMAVGTLGYMAPEQAMGERGVDPRADVFSLGCVLFTCLTGKPPFWSDRAGAVLMKILRDEPPQSRELRPEIPPALDDLLARMLQKNARARPQDGAAVAAAIAALGPMAPSVAGEATQRYLRVEALTRAEQRLVCFVVAGPRRSFFHNALASSSVMRAVSDAEGLVEAAQRHGGQVEFVADGSTLITLSGTGPATDSRHRGRALRALDPAHPPRRAGRGGDGPRRHRLGPPRERGHRSGREPPQRALGDDRSQ
ncbi:MAG: protein kinase [Minicystis sp.]